MICLSPKGEAESKNLNRSSDQPALGLPSRRENRRAYRVPGERPAGICTFGSKWFQVDQGHPTLPVLPIQALFEQGEESFISERELTANEGGEKEMRLKHIAGAGSRASPKGQVPFIAGPQDQDRTTKAGVQDFRPELSDALQKCRFVPDFMNLT